MRTSTSSVVLGSLLLACAERHAVATPDGGPVHADDAHVAATTDGATALVDSGAPSRDAGAVRGSVALETCLLSGGALAIEADVDNDDVRDHGEIIALAVSADRRLAVAGSDGMIKLWTLEGVVSEIGTTAFAYGSESAAAVANDAVYHGDRVVIGDVRGLVTAWSADGAMEVLGGTEPDVGIEAIAIDAEGRWLAHAEARDDGHVVVRELAGPGLVGPLTTALVGDGTLGGVGRLAFARDGGLVLAGADRDGPAIELRDAEDPTHVVAHRSEPMASARFDRLARGGSVLAAGISGPSESDGLIRLFDASLAPLPSPEIRGSAELGESGRVLFVIDAAGVLHALDLETRVALATLDTGHRGFPAARAPAAGGPGWAFVRRDPSGALLVAAFPSDSHVVAIGCE